jgi:hypothetical protein
MGTMERAGWLPLERWITLIRKSLGPEYPKDFVQK